MRREVPDGKPGTQWMCFYCLACGEADNADQALAFITFHEKSACPATAPSYDDPVDGFLVRMARRENLRRVYGDAQFPEYKRPYRRQPDPPRRESDFPPGPWLVAGVVLGYEVPFGKPYPHICGRTVPGDKTQTGKPLRYTPKHCLACAEEQP